MTKLNLPSISDLATTPASVNAAFQTIENWSDKVVMTDGTSPNTMQADFDLNGYRLLNLPAPVAPTEPFRLQDFEDELDALANVLGQPGLNWEGIWSGATAYIPKDLVTTDDGLFLCVVANQGETPFDGSTFWDTVILKTTGLIPRGAYSGATTYNRGDLVSYSNGWHICNANSTVGNTPPSSAWTTLNLYAANVEDIRLGAETIINPVTTNNYQTITAGHVITNIYVDASNNVTRIKTRPIQKYVGGVWATVTQV